MRIITDVINQISSSNQPEISHPDEVLTSELLKILDKLLTNSSDINAAIVSSVDGLAMAQKLSTNMDEHRFAAMSSALLALSDSLVQESQQGQTENVLIEGNNGKVFILHAGPKLLLTVFTLPTANLGMSLAHARRAIEEINALIEVLN